MSDKPAARCNFEMNAHTECVMNFLRTAREKGLPYLPGTYGEHDRCKESRNQYVSCAQGGPSSSKPLASPVVLPKEESIHNFLRQQSRYKDCQSELRLHGRCVRNYLESSIKTGKPYLFINSEGEDKCLYTRAMFESCMKSFQGGGNAGNMRAVHDPYRGGAGLSNAPDSDRASFTAAKGFSRSFSVRGRTVDL